MAARNAKRSISAILRKIRELWTVYILGKEDAKCGHLGTTSFAVFVRLSSKFAGWSNFVFQTIAFFCFSILTGFGGKITSKDWYDSKIKF